MKYIKNTRLIRNQIGILQYDNESLQTLYLIYKQQNLDYDIKHEYIPENIWKIGFSR